MKKLLFLLFLLPVFAFGQDCIKVDSIYSTAKLRELGSRDIRFGVKQIAEDLLSAKYCMSDAGKDIDIEYALMNESFFIISDFYKSEKELLNKFKHLII